MSLSTILTGAFTAIGAGIKAFFGAKEKKADAIVSGLGHTVQALKNAGASDAQIALAVSQSIQAETSSGGILSGWRQLVMTCIFLLIAAWFFGYSAPNINEPMPEALRELFEILKIGIMGYIPARTIDKALTSYQGRRLSEKIISKIIDKL